MNKRRDVLLFAVSLILVIPLVSAQLYNVVSNFGENLVSAAEAILGPVLRAVIGDVGGGDIFFVKVLLLILLFVVIQVAIRKIPAFENQRGVSIILAAVVSVLAVRYMTTSDIIEGVLLPYSVLGVAITTILPFIIFFYFIQKSGLVGFSRRLAWIAYGIIFLVLWASRMEEISDDAHLIYFLILLAIIASLVFDKSIQRYFGTHELAVWKRGANQKVIAGLQSEYMHILHVDSPQANARRHAIESHIKRLGGNLKDLGV